uniref:Uncharacterized protein n=1 Tax=Anguilla anguilla TaxID=7936 RepID=A0A0E9PM35_ANGAN
MYFIFNMGCPPAFLYGLYLCTTQQAAYTYKYTELGGYFAFCNGVHFSALPRPSCESSWSPAPCGSRDVAHAQGRVCGPVSARSGSPF